jgi:uncharacterized protein YndB with AHSA1/START domain
VGGAALAADGWRGFARRRGGTIAPPLKRFETTTTINADADVIWALLTDAAGYPSWNTTVDGVDGQIALGAKITVHAKINPGRTFPVKVAQLDPPRRMTWVGAMPAGPVPGRARIHAATSRRRRRVLDA